jgi:hypothetical protein
MHAQTYYVSTFCFFGWLVSNATSSHAFPRRRCDKRRCEKPVRRLVQVLNRRVSGPDDGPSSAKQGYRGRSTYSSYARLRKTLQARR